MLSQELYHVPHQYCSIQRAPSIPGGITMGGSASEMVFDIEISVAGVIVSHVGGEGVPVNKCIDIVKKSSSGHVGFADTKFLCRSPENLNRSL